MKISVPILFTLYKIIGSDLNSLNHTSRSIVLIYSLNQQQLACTGIYMYLDSANISLYIKVSSNNYTIHYGIFVKISSFKSVYNCFVSTSMVWESHLLINYIIRMTQSVMSDTTGEQFQLNSTPLIWLYTCASRNALNTTSIFFIKTHFESIKHLFGIICFSWILLPPPIDHIPELFLFNV